jgi:hypothetical protein
MNNKHYLLQVLFLGMLLSFGACKKNTVDASALYVPTIDDVTANATLQELQEGRILYMDNCNSCHSLYSPDSYSTAKWKSVMSSMAPKTSMSASDIQLVTKYVCRGKQ